MRTFGIDERVKMPFKHLPLPFSVIEECRVLRRTIHHGRADKTLRRQRLVFKESISIFCYAEEGVDSAAL